MCLQNTNLNSKKHMEGKTTSLVLEHQSKNEDESKRSDKILNKENYWVILKM